VEVNGTVEIALEFRITHVEKCQERKKRKITDLRVYLLFI
jgi:hypothetical protein